MPMPAIRRIAQDAAIDLAHVLRQEQASAADRVAPHRARRAPEFDGRISRPEEIGEDEHQEMRGVQGAAPGIFEADLGPIGMGGEQRRHDDGDDGDGDGD